MTDDVVKELNAELALIAELPYRVPIHHLARRARDEILALRVQLDAVRGIAGNERRLSEAIAQQARTEAHDQARAEAHEELQAARREIVALRRTIRLGPDLPALAREQALEEAARIAENGCLVPPDGGSPTEEEREMCEHIAAAIRALKGEG